MRAWQWLVVSLVALAVLYAVLVLALLILGRRENARAIAGFVPDCAVLLARLVRDPAIPRRNRLALVLLAGYLALPFDLVPDFIPVVGYLDDALVVLLALRLVTRMMDAEQLREHWPGPEASLRVVLRLAGAASGDARAGGPRWRPG